MAKPNTHWAFDRSFHAIEYSFRVQTNLLAAGGLVSRLLSQLERPSTDGIPTYRVTRWRNVNTPFALSRGRRRLDVYALEAGAIQGLLWQINSEAIRLARKHLLVHAATASWRGKGILMPAQPESGKTTLVTGLTRSGFDYLSDEAAVIDPETLLLHPYPKPLSMEPGTLEAMPELKEKLPSELSWTSRLNYHLQPSDVRVDSIGAACAVGFVIAPCYRPGTRTEIERISQAGALVALADHSFNFHRFGARGLTALAKVVEGAECYRLRMGDLPSAVEATLDVVSK